MAIQIYGFVHIDKVIYVGSTSDLVHRMSVHKAESKENKLPYYELIREIGWDKIEVKVLCTCDESVRLTTERAIIEQYKETTMNKIRPIITAEERKQKKKERRDKPENKEKQKKVVAEWYQNNKTQHREKNKVYCQNNKEHLRQKAREWEARNPEKMAVKRARDRAREKERVWCPICQEELSRGKWYKHQKTMKHVVNLIEY